MMNKNIVSRVFCFKWFERVHLKFFESFGLNGKCLIAVHLKNKNLVIVVTQAGRMLKQDLGKSHCAFCLNQWLCKIWMQQNLIPLISRCCRNTCTCIIIHNLYKTTNIKMFRSGQEAGTLIVTSAIVCCSEFRLPVVC